MNYNLEGRSKEAINLDACRFCLKVSRSKMKIDEKIKSKYQNLMNEELLENPKLSQNCCKVCVSDLDQCVIVKNKILNNQRFLLELAELDTKQEPDSEEDNKPFNEIESVIVKTEIEEEEGELTFSNDQEFEEEKIESLNKRKTQEIFSFADSENDGYHSNSPTSDPSDEDFKIEDEKQAKLNDFECKDCGRILSGKHQLKLHRAKRHPSNKKEMKSYLEKIRRAEDRKQRVRCPDCGLELCKSSLRKHQVYQHTKSSTYTCDICGYICSNKLVIINHMRSKHRKNQGSSFKCKVCDKVFSSRKNWKMHYDTIHDNKYIVVCDLCGIQFKTRPAYQVHIRSKHTGETPYKCSKCPKEYHSASSLHSHVVKFHSEKSETCQICSKTYRSKFHLNYHIKITHEEKRFVCTVEGCKRKYATKTKLNHHLYKHTGLKKFVCNFCEKPYKDRTGLEQHIHSVHLNFKINCLVPFCTDTFHRRDYLRTHLRRKHAHLGQEEVQRLVKEAVNIKLPNIKPYYTNIMNPVDADKFKKFKENNLYKVAFPEFKDRVEKTDKLVVY